MNIFKKLFLLSFFPFLLHAEFPEISFSFLPQKHLVPLFPANSTEHRITLTKILEMSNYTGGMGGNLPIVDISSPYLNGQFSVAGTFYAHLKKIGRHVQVITGDFFVDFMLDVAINENLSLRFGVGHTSQHFVDDAFEILGYQNSLNYVRDYVKFFGIQKIPLIRGFVYGGFYYNYLFVITHKVDNRWIFQIGSEMFNVPITPLLTFYTGFDIKFRGELNFATSQNYQVGIKLGDGNSNTVRFAYNYRTGLEERGQFYNQYVRWNTLGIYFDF